MMRTTRRTMRRRTTTTKATVSVPWDVCGRRGGPTAFRARTYVRHSRVLTGEGEDDEDGTGDDDEEEGDEDEGEFDDEEYLGAVRRGWGGWGWRGVHTLRVLPAASSARGRHVPCHTPLRTTGNQPRSPVIRHANMTPYGSVGLLPVATDFPYPNHQFPQQQCRRLRATSSRMGEDSEGC